MGALDGANDINGAPLSDVFDLSSFQSDGGRVGGDTSENPEFQPEQFDECPVKGLDMKAVYALKAGTNQIAAKVEAWDVPMLVPGGVPYDIAIEQSAGAHSDPVRAHARARRSGGGQGLSMEIGIRSSQMPLGSKMVTCILAEVMPISNEITIQISSNSFVKMCS